MPVTTEATNLKNVTEKVHELEQNYSEAVLKLENMPRPPHWDDDMWQRHLRHIDNLRYIARFMSVATFSLRAASALRSEGVREFQESPEGKRN